MALYDEEGRAMKENEPLEFKGVEFVYALPWHPIFGYTIADPKGAERYEKQQELTQVKQ